MKHYPPDHKKHYHYGDVSELKNVDWNFGENQRKGNNVLTFVVIIMWVCLCLLVL